jgi:ribosomal protein S25
MVTVSPTTYKLNNYDEPYPSKNHEIVAKKIKEIVYKHLNKLIEKHHERIVQLLKVKRPEPNDLIILDEKTLTKIKREVENAFPTIYMLFSKIHIGLAIMHYVSRFLLEYSEILREQGYKVNARSFLLSNIYSVFLTKFSDVRTYLLQQACHLIVYSQRLSDKVTNILYNYTDIDEDKLILNCVNVYCTNIVYKYDIMKSKDLDATIKAFYKKVLGYVFLIDVGDITSESTRCRVVTNIDEIQLLTPKQRAEFLTNIFMTIQEHISENYLESLTLGKKYLVDYVNEMYKIQDKVVMNVVRLLLSVVYNNINVARHKYQEIYNDFIELSKILIDEKYKEYIERNYPELYRFAKSIVIPVKGKQLSKFRNKISPKKFTEVLVEKFSISKYGKELGEDVILDISKNVAIRAFRYFSNTIFLHPFTQEPIMIRDQLKFLDNFARLVVNFLVG